jgi:hypothetical protein
MNKKYFFLTALILIILSLSFIANSPNTEIDQNYKSVQTDNPNKGTNEIKNIEYNNFDSAGNNFIIFAKSGIINDEKTEIINMKDVKSVIKTTDNKIIEIKADRAVYNFKNYNTNFKENVSIIDGINTITCEELDFLFSKKVLVMKTNIVYNTQNTVFFSDIIEFDLITKKIKINMFDKDDFVNLTFKKNGSY